MSLLQQAHLRWRRIVIAFLVLLTAAGAASPIAHAVPMLSGTAVARAVMKYFGKEGIEEGTEFMARQGGREMAERIAATALREGGEETAEKVAKFAADHGPEALRAFDNAPQLAPVLAALEELPESQVRGALSRLAAGASGRELAASVSRVGASALRTEMAHPGIGAALTRSLGDEGADLASKLSTDQAIAVTRHADDLAALPTSQRQGVMALLHSDAERMVQFMGRFAADNPGKTLFTAATTTVLLAESERILGGDEIVFDAEGNPIVISKTGLAGRTLQAGGRVVAEVSNSYIRPLYLTVMAFVVTFATLFLLMKLWHVHQREKLATTGLLKEPETLDANATPSKTIE